MKVILIMIMLNGSIKTKALPTMAVCEQVKVEVMKSNIKNLSSVFCAKK